jgi:quinohemoprotein ethanol dehydrogenase
MSMKNTLIPLLVAALAAGCGGSRDSGNEQAASHDSSPAVIAMGPAVTGIDGARLVAANNDASNWLSHGRTYDEQRFSPLEEINRENVGELGLAWYFDVPTQRGMEATPIVVDGRMYVTGSWSIVYALDAATGEELWRYDPKVPKSWGQYACCDVVNRGVAVWGDSVFVGTLDGYLVALDAATGEERWRTDTINRKAPYTITGAPRIVNGLVVIGNGGADYGVRGFVSAYDADSGEMRWRFYTVPGNPEDGFENEVLEKAAATWNGEWWQYGGGGTVWDSMAYDPELDLLYIGVGNGSPWNQKVRSPGGVVNRCVAAGNRRIRLALPDNTRRKLGLHGNAAHDPRQSRNRRRPAQGSHAGAEERLLLRTGSNEWRADFGRTLRRRHVGNRHRQSDRPSCRGTRGPLR